MIVILNQIDNNFEIVDNVKRIYYSKKEVRLYVDVEKYYGYPIHLLKNLEIFQNGIKILKKTFEKSFRD